MGQTLSEPITSKESSYCQNDFFKVGSSCMQGWRVNMEDSHTHILSLPDDPGTSFFAVYDGHGGATVAQYAGKHLHKFIVKRPEYPNDIELAMKKAFLDIDDAMLYDESWGEQMAGSTAIAVLIKNHKLYCANAGDSRAVACINGKTDILSIDHKPNNEIETKRINDGGGYVEFNRVNGNLALSRALGDFIFKGNAKKKAEEQIVTAYPDVETREITEDWEFVVLACDGIWDVMSNEEVVEFCRKRIGMGMYPEEICEELMTQCLAPDCQMGGLGGDNMTVVLVCFLHEKPYEKLVAKCADAKKDNTTEEEIDLK
uniref:protein-serine/threonine phosphatase n=1 Tax=Tabanus bromius TaxID=304241 RepID=A0A0K8TN81_TABBR